MATPYESLTSLRVGTIRIPADQSEAQRGGGASLLQLT
jgi:hypothetical protein